MANSYTKAAFGVRVTEAEADLLRRVIAAVDLVGDATVAVDELETRYRALGSDFAELFPRTPDSPFGGGCSRCSPTATTLSSTAISPLNCPILRGGSASSSPETSSGSMRWRRCCSVALPRSCLSASNGPRTATGCGPASSGRVGVDHRHAIEFGHTAAMLDRAIGRALDEGADGFVLAARDGKHGLSFRNNAGGFGRLAEAQVFSEIEAARVDPGNGLEWLAMPAPLRT